MRWFSLFSLMIVALPALCAAQDSPATGVYAIVGARIEVGDGRVIEHGTVLIRDGVIEAVGDKIKVPIDAEVIKGDGLRVFPGFIDADSSQGLQLPDPHPDQDVPPDRTEAASPSMREANRKSIRPEAYADDYLALTDDTLKAARQAGFSTALILPAGDTINGIGALVNLNGKPRRDCVVKPSAAVRFTFHSQGRSYPDSLMGITALTRQTLMDARYYRVLQTAFDKGNSHRPPDDATLTALQPVLSGTIPVVYEADSRNEIQRSLRIADQFSLKLMLSGGAEAWKVAPLLAERKVPVIVKLAFGRDPTDRSTPTAPGGFPGRPPGGGGSSFPGRGGRPRRSSSGGPPTSTPGGPPPIGPPGGGPPAGAPPNGGTPAANPDEDQDSDTPPAVMADRHAKWQEKVANAAALSKAGVLFAFTTRGERSMPEFLADLRRAVKAGLPRDAALRALTLDAARLLGVDRQIGTVEAGKTAAIIVMSGDFTDEKSEVRYLFIDHEKFEPGKDISPPPPMPFGRFAGDEDEGESE